MQELASTLRQQRRGETGEIRMIYSYLLTTSTSIIGPCRCPRFNPRFLAMMKVKPRKPKRHRPHYRPSGEGGQAWTRGTTKKRKSRMITTSREMIGCHGERGGSLDRKRRGSTGEWRQKDSRFRGIDYRLW